jgi:hypothetical protein
VELDTCVREVSSAITEALAALASSRPLVTSHDPKPVNDQSDPAVIEMVGEALQAYSYAPASEQKLRYRMHPESQVRQGAGPKRNSEKSCEAPSAAS